MLPEAGPGTGPHPNRDVDIVAGEIGHGVGRVQPHGKLRPGDLEASEPGGEPVGREVWAVLIASTLSSWSTRPEKPSLSRSNASETTGASLRPASLKVTRRFERTNRDIPSRSSSSRIW